AFKPVRAKSACVVSTANSAACNGCPRYVVMKASTTSLPGRLLRDTTTAGRTFLPDKLVNGKGDRTIVPRFIASAPSSHPLYKDLPRQPTSQRHPPARPVA